MNFELLEWKDEYVTDIASLANNKKIANNLRNMFPHPYTLDDAKTFIAMMQKDDPKKLCLAIVVDGRAAGSIGVFVQDDVYCKSAEIGYWLGEPYWGQGIMTAAVKQICELAFRELPIVRIYAEIFAYNNASAKVLQKVGFLQEGILRNSVYKNGAIFDSVVYALLK